MDLDSKSETFLAAGMISNDFWVENTKIVFNQSFPSRGEKTMYKMSFFMEES